MKSQGAPQPTRRLARACRRASQTGPIAPVVWSLCAVGLLASAASLAPVALGVTAGSTQPTATQPASRPAATPNTLLVHGTADRFWIGLLESSNDAGRTVQKTILRGQSIPGGQWREVTTIPAPIQGLSHLQGDAVVLLDGGSWRRLNAALSTGPTVPGVGPLLAWHAAPKAVYAVRDFEGGRAGALDDEETDSASSTQPSAISAATRPTSASTTHSATARAATQAGTVKPNTRATPNPTTIPSPVLFIYERSQWHAIADLPRGLPSPTPPIQLSSLADRPVLLARISPTLLNSFAWLDNRWEDWGTIQIPAGATFTLVSIPNALALWTSNQDGQMRLHFRTEGQAWSAPQTLATPSGVTGTDTRSFTMAGGEFRLVLLRDRKLFEQRYALDGAPRGALVELAAPLSGQAGGSAWMFQTLILVGMVFVILLTLYRRRTEPVPPPKE